MEEFRQKIENCKINSETIEKLKEKIQKLYDEITTKNDQITQLRLRAAAGFEELTPRFKNLPEICGELKIKPPKNKNSNDFIRNLIDSYKNLLSRNNK